MAAVSPAGLPEVGSRLPGTKPVVAGIFSIPCVKFNWNLLGGAGGLGASGSKRLGGKPPGG